LAASADVQCLKIGGEYLANSIYTAASSNITSNATWRCDNGYKEMPKLEKTGEGTSGALDTFSGGCVFKDILMLFFIFKEDKPNSIFLPEDYNGVIIHWLILDL
jgi:hypothetical protein